MGDTVYYWGPYQRCNCRHKVVFLTVELHEINLLLCMKKHQRLSIFTSVNISWSHIYGRYTQMIMLWNLTVKKKVYIHPVETNKNLWRFQKISKLLHFANMELTSMLGVSHALNFSNNNLHSLHNTEKEFSTGERRIIWKGRLMFCMYMPNMPNKYSTEL